MTRRVFLKMMAAAMFLAHAPHAGADEAFPVDLHKEKKVHENEDPQKYAINDDRLKDYLLKVRNPDAHHPDDIVLGDRQQQVLRTVMEKLTRICLNVGNGNFSTLGFDEALLVARRQVSIGEFTTEELAFMEMIYGRDAGDYGFFGNRQAVDLLHVIDSDKIVKIPYSGNYLFKGESLEKYNRIKQSLGEEVILTSGIRGIVKQFHLFLAKALRYQGNLSLASRSLAPPGYSYHATGDFDVGQRGLGEGNFSDMFITTPVFKRLTEQGLVDCRYWQDNLLGVRYEPWHIRLS